ncbi:hypothetical protein [Pseudomarimonas salicorniae]|uniref:TIGR03016 family PEP-CTERM system-associated outer membrane protein n=1 Tax=Pseudomarimonas salicorniae TaxID=2933270 RepID=A0ABT0GHG7_9GAMM|nr:hypothetical protein [Lysobacter sp. CAU 1642]MCK7593991.1 hypothetical protein [Lysobacter sp. CAU 1642]
MARLPLALLIGALLAAPGARAWTLDYRVDLRIEHASNLARRAEPVDDLVTSPRLSLALLEEGDRLSLRAAGDLEKRFYDRSGFEDETLARVGLRGNWKILDQRLGFAFEDSLSDQPVNSFLAESPDNRQRVHVWTAGPTLTLRPTPRARLAVELRTGGSDAERNREFDATRSSLAARALFELDPLSTLSAHAEAGDVDFDLATGATPDYRRQNLFVRYDRRLEGGDWSLDAGWTGLRFDARVDRPARRIDEPLLRARAGFELRPRTRLDARLQRQVSDAAQDVLDAAPTPEQFEQPIAAADLRTTVVSSEVFIEQGGSLALTHGGDTWNFALVGYLREQRYESSESLDQDLEGLSVALARQVRARHRLGAFAAREDRGFLSSTRDDQDLRYGLTWTWQRTRRLAIGLELSRSERDSTDPTQRFDDDRALLTLSLRR